MKLVIKGAYYYDEDSDKLLVPHYTGEYAIVDCDRFMTMKALKKIYNEKYINGVKDSPIEYNGKKYYDAEYSPRDVGDWELLSDLSELEHIEDNFDF